MTSHPFPSSPPPSGGDPGPACRPRILLAVGEPVTRENLGTLLAAYYTVQSVMDAQAVLEVLGQGPPPDLLLCGLTLPTPAGLDLLRTVRTKPSTTRLPVIVIVGQEMTVDQLTDLEELADDFVAWPAGDAELRARVRHALGQARDRRDARERENHLRTELVRHRESSRALLVGEFAEAGEALHACEQRFLAVTGRTAAGVARLDLAGCIVEANARFCEITGYAEDELLGRTMLSLAPPGDTSHEEQLLTRFFREGTPLDRENRCVRKNGTLAWLRASLTPLRTLDDRMHAALAVVLDISGQREMREHVRENEARLSAMFAQSAVGLSEITLDGRFLHVNDQLCRMLGRTRAELLAADVSVVTHPEDQPNTRRVFQCLVETGEPASIDKRYLHADGTVIWANSSLTRLNDGWGQPRGVLAVTLDVTARVLAEQALREGRETSAGHHPGPETGVFDS